VPARHPEMETRGHFCCPPSKTPIGAAFLEAHAAQTQHLSGTQPIVQRRDIGRRLLEPVELHDLYRHGGVTMLQRFRRDTVLEENSAVAAQYDVTIAVRVHDLGVKAFPSRTGRYSALERRLRGGA
jgi:hypothetical protein